jgi:hypothetical protein
MRLGMAEKFEATNGKNEHKNKILKAIADIEIYPTINAEKISLEKYKKLPLSQIVNLGTGFEPLTAAFQKVIKGNGTTSGLYNVTIPKGAHLAEFKNGSGYLGSILKGNGAVGGGQAILNPLVFNPTMLFTAAALATIDKKLDNIQEMQRKVLEFLEQKERSELIGNVNTLIDVHNNYKYNWNNSTYINNNHVKVLDIKDRAEGNIVFYRGRILELINKKPFVHNDQWIEQQLEKLSSEFLDYQLVLYLYAFSSFLNIIFIENFNSKYLDSISKKIESYSSNYNRLYTDCYKKIHVYTQSSLQTKMYKVSTTISREIEDNLIVNRNIEKFAVETFALVNENQEKKRSESIEHTIKEFKKTVEEQNVYVQPFLENINTINKLYNQPLKLLFDKENIYIGTTEEQ